ncbi:MAG: tRNA (adenosine(37)-N6)-threonylcarbamoyltransferase complex ATPase subunit type 1 TsaE [Flavobacteriaceae bacterium]|jgi:tRNA threonylcarbamoyladenosine biosynthesis protein TsaE
MRFEYKLNNIDNIAKELINSFKNKIVLFNGDMGSGKTTIISSIVNILGTNVKVSSPTFSIVNEYNIDEGSIYHFDFYRLKNSNEALDLGIYEYLNSGNWNFIEWGEKIQELLNEEFTTVNIKVISKEKRLLELKQ